MDWLQFKLAFLIAFFPGLICAWSHITMHQDDTIACRMTLGFTGFYIGILLTLIPTR